MRSIFMALAITLQGFAGHATVTEPPKYLVSAEEKKSSTAAELQSNYAFLKRFIKNGFTAFRITYNTKTTEGKTVVASGALLVPDVSGPLPLLSYHHGTIFPSNERSAPSYLPEYSAELGIAKLFASNGYIVALPDYIGYGSTKNETHPYGAYKLVARASVDMLQAVQEFCDNKKLSLSGKNFFSGWSEGAAVALATVQQLEQDSFKYFQPTASVLNAGPYYSSAFVNHIVDAETSLRYLKTYVWVLRSYNDVYKINKPTSWYFKAPYAQEIQLDGEADVPLEPRLLFTDQFIKSYKTGKEVQLEAALNDNDLWNWKPASRVVFCHGDKDDYVPIFNSEKAFKEMSAAGADVSFKVFKGQNHSGGIMAFVQTAFTEFEKYK